MDFSPELISRGGKGPLWRAGVSQPPFLIALAGKFVDLGAEFNVRGLGRGDIAPEEAGRTWEQRGKNVGKSDGQVGSYMKSLLFQIWLWSYGWLFDDSLTYTFTDDDC